MDDWKNLVREWHPTGSNYICNPPVEDTDIDYICLVDDIVKTKKDMGFEYLHTLSDLEYDSAGLFRSIRWGKLNWILTETKEFYEAFVAATEEAKRRNLRNKMDRINLFRGYLSKVEIEKEEILF